MTRTLIAAAAAASSLTLAIAAPALAQAPAAAAAEGKSVGATKAFRYLDKFLEVPASQRSKIRVNFYLKRDGRAAVGLHPVLVDGDQRTPLPLSASGRFERLPTLDQLRRKPTLVIDAPADAKLSNKVEIEAEVKRGTEIDAAEVTEAIRQVGGVVRSTVGALAVLMPAVRASFPGAGSGVAINASGA
ncbi:hypothetical protein BH09PSE2_BH09PSE2_15870 [soil metagenome]